MAAQRAAVLGAHTSLTRCGFSESQPIPVWIEEMDLTPPRLHHDLTIELTSYCVQVADPQIDEAVGVGVTTVL